MSHITTLGYFKEYSDEQYKEDKERFYRSKLYLLACLLVGYPDTGELKEEQISKMDSIIKKKLSGNIKNIKNINYYLNFFSKILVYTMNYLVHR